MHASPPFCSNGIQHARRDMTCFFLPPRRSAVALFSLLLLSFCLGRTQGRSYFPEQGSGALQQRALEARHPWVAMMVSLEPGMEDFPGIA